MMLGEQSYAPGEQIYHLSLLYVNHKKKVSLCDGCLPSENIQNFLHFIILWNDSPNHHVIIIVVSDIVVKSDKE